MCSTPLIRWSRELNSLRAITVKQPYAWLIVNGCKDIEVRSRPIRLRVPLLIHAGLSEATLAKREVRWLRDYGINLPDGTGLERGGVVGLIDVVDCKDHVRSPWYVPYNYAWVLARPRRLPFRRCKGSQGFFRPNFE